MKIDVECINDLTNDVLMVQHVVDHDLFVCFFFFLQVWVSIF